MSTDLNVIVDLLDRELKIEETRDYPNALNGLQIQNNGIVSRIAMAVDASEQAINKAINKGADLLIVHHGLFWPGLQPITGSLWRKVDAAIKNNLAVYSSHLPLDNHPKYGNNARLISAGGMRSTGEGFPYLGANLGLQAQFDGSLKELIARLKSTTTGRIDSFLQHAPDASPGRILVCSGGGGDSIADAAKMGIDTYITGEASHWVIPTAAELGINLILGGHYETETFGVKALGELLLNQFGLPGEFIDLPLSSYSATGS